MLWGTLQINVAAEAGGGQALLLCVSKQLFPNGRELLIAAVMVQANSTHGWNLHNALSLTGGRYGNTKGDLLRVGKGEFRKVKPSGQIGAVLPHGGESGVPQQKFLILNGIGGQNPAVHHLRFQMQLPNLIGIPSRSLVELVDISGQGIPQIFQPPDEGYQIHIVLKIPSNLL